MSTHCEKENVGRHQHHHQKTKVDTDAVEDGPEDTHHLNDNQVVGDQVGGTCGSGALLPPSLVTQTEDEDTEREDEEDVGASEGDKDEVAISGV